jgi:hypothetical protein
MKGCSPVELRLCRQESNLDLPFLWMCQLRTCRPYASHPGEDTTTASAAMRMRSTSAITGHWAHLSLIDWPWAKRRRSRNVPGVHGRP